jgi:uncharacterized protein (TIGR00251 family)
VQSCRIEVRVTPRARADEIAGRRGSAWMVRVTAPPVEDRANAAVCRLVAARLGVRPRQVSVVSGARSRAKVLRVEGVGAADAARALGGQE